MDGFPSGQRGQTVNLLSVTSVVRIHPHPFNNPAYGLFYILSAMIGALDAAGWSSLEARRAHNPEAAGSNPAPATLKTIRKDGLFIILWRLGTRRPVASFLIGSVKCSTNVQQELRIRQESPDLTLFIWKYPGCCASIIVSGAMF